MVGKAEKEKLDIELGLTSKPPEEKMAKGIEAYRKENGISISEPPMDTTEKDKLDVELGITSKPPEEKMAKGTGQPKSGDIPFFINPLAAIGKVVMSGDRVFQEIETKLGETASSLQRKAEESRDTMYSPRDEPRIEDRERVNIREKSVKFSGGAEKDLDKLSVELGETSEPPETMTELSLQEEAALKGFAARTGSLVVSGAREVVSDLTFIARPETVGAAAVGLATIATDEEARTGLMKSQAEAFIADPVRGVVAGTASLLGDVAILKGIKSVMGDVSEIRRLDALDITTNPMAKIIEVDDALTGAYKYLEPAETTIKGRVSTRRVSSNLGDVLDDLSVKGDMDLFVSRSGDIDEVSRIRLTQGEIEDLLDRNSVIRKGGMEVDLIEVGSEKGIQVDAYKNVMGDESLLPSQHDFFEATGKELSPQTKILEGSGEIVETSIKLVDEGYPLGELEFDIKDLEAYPPRDPFHYTPPDLVETVDDIIVTRTDLLGKSSFERVELDSFLTKVDLGDIEDLSRKTTGDTMFGGKYFDESRPSLLEEGKHRYDVRGAVELDTPIIEDVINKIEPKIGKKTPFARDFQQPGLTGSLRDIERAFGDDVDMVRKLTDGPKDPPNVKEWVDSNLEVVVKEKIIGRPTDITKISSGRTRALLGTPIIGTKRARRTRTRGPPSQFDADAPPGLFTNYPTSKGAGLMPNPYFGEKEKKKDKTKGKGKSDSDSNSKEIEDELNRILDGSKDKGKTKLEDDEDTTFKDILDDFTGQDEKDKITPKPDDKTVQPDPDPTIPIPTPVPPIVIPYIIPDIIPVVIPDIIPDVVPKTIPKIIPKTIPDTTQKPKLPGFPNIEVIQSSPQKIFPYLPQRKKIKHIKLDENTLIGFELKTTKMISPEEILGKKKKFRWPKL